jgi:hypothetical protein
VPRSCGDARAFLCRGAGLEPRGTWQLRSPLLPCDGLGAPGHVAISEPSPAGWRAQCLRAHGGTGALAWRVAHSMPWGTWRYRSSLLAGGVLCASWHMAEPKPSGTRNKSGAVG